MERSELRTRMTAVDGAPRLFAQLHTGDNATQPAFSGDRHNSSPFLGWALGRPATSMDPLAEGRAKALSWYGQS